MKNKKISNIIALSITMIMLSMAFVGCSKNDNKVSKFTENSNYTENGEYPVVKENIKVSVFASMRPSVTSYEYDKNSYTKAFTDKTGIEFEWLTSTEVDRNTKRNAMLTSGTYPDVFLEGYFDPAELSLYGSQGILIPLNDLIDKYAPNYKKALKENPLIKDAITSPDGNMYALSRMGIAYHTQAPDKLWINKAWLDKLGLDMPTTTDEFYKVLKAFKEKDPNGNGIADEVPLSGSTNGWNTKPELFLMNAFVRYTPAQAKTMFVKDGTIYKAQATEGYKEGVEYLNKLYKEGLLDNLTYSQNNDQLKKLGTNPGVAILGCYGAGALPVAMDMSQDRWHDYVAVPALKGPNGEQNIAYMPDYGSNVLSITDKCKDPIAVIRAFDLLYSDDLTYVLGNNVGELGIDYEKSKEGDINANGTPSTYTLVTKVDERDGRTWNQMGPYRRPSNWDELFTAKPGDVETLLYRETKEKYLPYKPEKENILPTFILNEEDSRTIVDIEQAMNKYIDEKFISFVMGTEDINTEWDNYIAELDKIGLKKYIQVYQKLYDEKEKK